MEKVVKGLGKVLSPASLKADNKRLAAHYAREIKRRLGRGTKVEHTHAGVTFPPGWEWHNYHGLKVTPKMCEPIIVELSLSVALEESSGRVKVDGYNVAFGRASTPELAIDRMLGEAFGYG